MFQNLFPVSTTEAAFYTSIYITTYALGRLFSGFVADIIGLIRTFQLIIILMIILLVIVPQTSTSIPHDATTSPGLRTFIGILWSIGFLVSLVFFCSLIY